MEKENICYSKRELTRSLAKLSKEIGNLKNHIDQNELILSLRLQAIRVQAKEAPTGNERINAFLESILHEEREEYNKDSPKAAKMKEDEPVNEALTPRKFFSCKRIEPFSPSRLTYKAPLHNPFEDPTESKTMQTIPSGLVQAIPKRSNTNSTEEIESSENGSSDSNNSAINFLVSTLEYLDAERRAEGLEDHGLCKTCDLYRRSNSKLRNILSEMIEKTKSQSKRQSTFISVIKELEKDLRAYKDTDEW